MPYEPLHHKYRPQTFAELVGQEAIATTLSNALEQKRIAPAYLFSGPRGTGKTSSARILAKSLNCLNSANPTPSPCGECEVCRAIARGSALDVIEIDAASNTGVDNIRELIERSQFAPVQCRYKVYVIDECHMLSVAAFNALLKTLEEPPNHVVFVLATTDPQRVLPTIISRCQRFDYRRIPLDAMVGHLRKIARIENIDIPLESVTLISQIANGGLRDAESLLDQLSLMVGEIVPDKVWDLVGAVPERDLFGLIQVVRSNNPEAVIQQCRNLLNRGREPLVVLQNLASFYLNLLIAKTAPQRGDLIAVTQPTWQALCEEAQGWDVPLILKGQQHLKESEYQLKNTTQPRLWLEITLLGLLPAALVNIQGVATATVNIPAPIAPPKIQPASQPILAPPSPAVHPFGDEITRTSPAPLLVSAPIQVATLNSAPAIASPPVPSVEPSAPEILPVIAPVAVPIPEPSVEPPAETSTNIAAFNGNGNGNGMSPAPVPIVQPITPVETIPVPASVANSSSSPTISALEREQLWETMIAQLQPPTTQHLLRQQGCLVDFNGLMAVIGIKSQPLLSIAKSKQKNIEQAFQKACQKEVKVSFQIGHESTAALDFMAVPGATPVAPDSTSTPPTATATHPPAIAPPSQQPNPFNEAPIPAPVAPAPAIHQPAVAPPIPQYQPPAPSPVPTPSVPAQSVQPQASPTVQGILSQSPVAPASTELENIAVEIVEGDRLHSATHDFAELFGGEVIELPHLAPDESSDMSLPVIAVEPVATPQPETVANGNGHGRPPVTTSIDDDIPF
ncbi:MAG: DNA polymerase III subunit gamma/tau [Limnothrix sp.]